MVAPPGIDRIFLHNPATNNRFTSDNLDPKLIKQCRHFHFGYPPLMEKMFENEGKELMNIFSDFKLEHFEGLFIFQRPYWGSYVGFSVWEKLKLRLDELQFLNRAARIYFAVFRKP